MQSKYEYQVKIFIHFIDNSKFLHLITSYINVIWLVTCVFRGIILLFVIVGPHN